jgi:hypothetical protein
MRAAETTTILGRKYVIAPLPAGKALKTVAKLGKVIAPVLLQLAAEGNLAGGKFDISGVVGHLDDDMLESMSRDFAQQCQIELATGSGKLVEMAQHFDTLFAGSLDEWFAWFSFCAEMNFGPLVAGAMAKMGAVRATQAASAPST